MSTRPPLTDEQERAIEALSLRDGGFASEVPVRFVTTPRGVYVVRPTGEVVEFESNFSITGFRRLMADTYGRGATP